MTLNAPVLQSPDNLSSHPDESLPIVLWAKNLGELTPPTIEHYINPEIYKNEHYMECSHYGNESYLDVGSY